jgi:flagellar FliL protein
MSEIENEKSNTEGADGDQAPRSFKKIIIIAVVLLLAGGGGFYYWRSSSAAATEAAAEKSEKTSADKKTKAKKESSDANDDSVDTEKSVKKSNSLKTALPEDDDVKKVIELPPFIVNLADTEQSRYLRMTVSLGVGGDEGGAEEKPDQLFITRVRNAMLAVLGDKTSEEILTVEGKAKLRKELLKAAQAASDEPQVQAIYITDFIIQL